LVDINATIVQQRTPARRAEADLFIDNLCSKTIAAYPTIKIRTMSPSIKTCFFNAQNYLVFGNPAQSLNIWF
jgi:hypothetical protein